MCVWPFAARVEDSFQKGLEVRTPLRLEVETGSGDIAISRAGGRVRAEAGSGDISLAEVAGGAEVALGSGDVRLSLPRDSQFNLWAETYSGEIEIAFPLTLSKKVGRRLEGRVGENPTAQIRIKTSSGDISIRPRPLKDGPRRGGPPGATLKGGQN